VAVAIDDGGGTDPKGSGGGAICAAVPVNVADDAVGGEEVDGAVGGAFREGVSPCASTWRDMVGDVEGIAGATAGIGGVLLGGAGGAGPSGGAGGNIDD